ncbi:MAG: MGMT family protein [Candidatus Levyibacteriota bacterium]
MQSNSFERIYDVVKKIPKGKVMTYKQVSIRANVATPRVVGFALHVNKDPKNIPCHRVVFADGSLTSGYAFGGEDVQKKKLQDEGVVFNINKVNLKESLFRTQNA